MHQTDSHHYLLIFGALMLAGYAAHVAGRRLHVPRVTLLLVVGLLSGPSGFDVLPTDVISWFPLITNFALAMVGFLLGESFAGKHLRKSGRVVLWVSVVQSIVTAAAVFSALRMLGLPFDQSLLLAGIAPATAPAAILDVVRERKAKGPLSDALLGVVAIDDAWGAILFSVFLVFLESGFSLGVGGSEIVACLWQVGGAGVLGVLVGLPMAALTGKHSRGEPTLTEALGFVFLCAGLARLLDVSYLIACMTLGATLANRATHYTRSFHAIEGISEPFLMVFFVLAGFELDPGALIQIGLAGAVYIASRSIGKIIGGVAGARLAKADPTIQKHIGWCLLPQAGVALGLALSGTERVPDAAPILQLVIASTVVFEIIGPLITLRSLRAVGEIR